jgi:sialate O-acetylesterase
LLTSKFFGRGALLQAFLLLLSVVLTPAVRADPRMPHLFSDHMVLQRDMPVRVWGWADPNESIEVTLAGMSQKTVAASDGRWAVALSPHAAGGPFILEVRGKKTVRLMDIVMGEVWVASGQSNMTYALAGAATGAQAVAKADDPYLRFFTVPKRIAVAPQMDTLPAAWELSTPDTAKGFSAVAYYFARDLRRSLGVPVGVILSAWPGTAGEEWTDPESLRRDPVLQPIAARWDASSADDKAFAATPRAFSLEFDDFELLPADPSAAPTRFSNFDDGSARVSTGGTWAYSWQGSPNAAFELSAAGRDGKGFSAKISGTQTGADDSRWEVSLRPDGTPSNLST